jgi:uncharacterized protein YbjT (DUF2867 family)
MILIVGATSKPGQRLVPMLSRKGYQVRVLARDQEKAALFSNMDVQVVIGDLRFPNSLQDMCEGVEAVVSCVTAAAAQHNHRYKNVFYGLTCFEFTHNTANLQSRNVSLFGL